MRSCPPSSHETLKRLRSTRLMFNTLASWYQWCGIAPANLRMAMLCIVRTVTAYPIDELIRGNLRQHAG